MATSVLYQICLHSCGTPYLVADKELVAISTLQLNEECSAKELFYRLAGVECQDVW